MTRARNLAFVLFICSATIAVQVDLLASMGSALRSACDNWEDGENYDCTDCSTGGGFPPEWEAEGSCDFSEIENEEDLLNTAAAYCMEIMEGFDQTCESEYGQNLASYFEWSLPEWDPCYQVAKDSGCWFTWATASCDAGPTSTWSGSCDGWNWCECD
jgi:hypothetical protein